MQRLLTQKDNQNQAKTQQTQIQNGLENGGDKLNAWTNITDGIVIPAPIFSVASFLYNAKM
jgi:hypothetical protein